MKNSSKKNVIRKAISLVWVSAMSVIMLSITASAASNDAKSITSKILKFAADVKYIAYGIAALAVIVLAIVLIAGGQGALQKAKGIAVPIIIGVLVLSFGTGLLGTFGANKNATKVGNAVNYKVGDIVKVDTSDSISLSDGYVANINS